MKKWRMLKINILFLKYRNVEFEDFNNNMLMLKMSFHIFFKEAKLIGDFVLINKEAIRKILKKYMKSQPN